MKFFVLCGGARCSVCLGCGNDPFWVGMVRRTDRTAAPCKQGKTAGRKWTYYLYIILMCTTTIPAEMSHAEAA